MAQFIVNLLLRSVTLSAAAGGYLRIEPRLSRRYGVKGRYYSWLVILLGFILPVPAKAGPRGLIRVSIPETPVIPRNSVAQTGGSLSLGLLSGIPWWQMAFWIWLLGAVLFLLYHGIRHLRFLNLVRRWQCPADPADQLLLDCVRQEMGIRQEIRLYRCPLLHSPTLVGFRRPRILLPDGIPSRLEGLKKASLCAPARPLAGVPQPTADEAAWGELLRLIVTHELVHFRRRDLWVKLVLLLVLSIHWFQPILYRVRRSIDQLCEQSCDAEVLRHGDLDLRRRYGEMMLAVASAGNTQNTILSTNFYGGKEMMKQRILSMMDTGKRKLGVPLILGALVVSLGAGLAIRAGAAHRAPGDPAMVASIATEYNKETGEMRLSLDGGETWAAEQDPVEFWTYEDYKAWMAQEKANWEALLEDADQDPVEGPAEGPAEGALTREDVDAMIQDHEETLARIEAGELVMKWADGAISVQQNEDGGQQIRFSGSVDELPELTMKSPASNPGHEDAADGTADEEQTVAQGNS